MTLDSIGGVWSIRSLPLLPGVLGSVRVPSEDQTDVFELFLYSIVAESSWSNS